MADEYIKRDAAIAALEDLHEDGELDYLGVFDAIKCTSAADVAPVIHGRWLDTDSLDAHYTPIYKCSQCWKDVADHYIKEHKFCLHCGARMDGGNKNGIV